MEQNKTERSRDLRFLLRAALAYLAAALLLLPIGAAIVTLLDLKASSFPFVGAAIAFLAAAAAGYAAKRKGGAPRWTIAGATALALTIVLLTTGFLISAERMNAESILLAAIPTLMGVILGVFLAASGKKLQKRRSPFRSKKQIKFT